MKKKNKIIVLSIAICLAIITIIITIFSISSSKPQEGDQQSEEDKVLTVLRDKELELPNIESVDRNNSPLLYDFLNSSLGYMYDKDRYNFTNYGQYYAVMFNKSNESKMFVEYYSYPEKVIYPILGNAPMQINLDATQTNIMNDWRSKVSDNRTLIENDWTVYIISANNFDNFNEFDCCSKGIWAGIDLTKCNNSTGDNIGKMQSIIDSGVGWPKEWIEREPFKTNILKEDGKDLSDPYWQQHSPGSYKIYKDENGKEHKISFVRPGQVEVENPGNGLKSITLKSTQNQNINEVLDSFIKYNNWSEK